MNEHFTNVITQDLRALFCGKSLGEGISRQVFACCNQKPDAVIKFETDAHSFQNVMEHEVWTEVRHTEHAKWFSPVLDISPNGVILLMRRTKPLTRDQLPERMPSFFTDLGMTNFGLLDGQIVCHDYGLNLLMSMGLSKRMRKADWLGVDSQESLV